MAKRKMIAHVRYNYRKEDAGRDAVIELDVDLSRFEKQYEKAQWELDNAVMASMLPYMPFRTGVFRNVTQQMSAAIAGSGTVYAAAPPFGRFLYEGKVMVDPQTNSPWARPGAKKIVTDRELDFDKSKNPKAQPKWFDAAKAKDGDKWVAMVKKTAGGG